MAGLDGSNLRQKLERLKKRERVAFAFLLCARMVPALEKFAKETNFDNAAYREGLDGVRQYLDQDRSSFNYSEIAERCLDHAPDTEEFNHPLTSAALNAALSIAAAVSFIADSDVNHIMEAADLARDTAALYAQAIEATPPRSLNFDEIMKHPLVQHELRQQTEDLEFLQAVSTSASPQITLVIKERLEEIPPLLPPGNG